MNEVEKVEQKQISIADDLLKSGGAIVALANKLVELSTDDRKRSLDTFNYIKTMVEKVEQDNTMTDELIENLTGALGKEFGTTLSKEELFKLVQAVSKKKDPTRLLEQLNKSLETSIGSSSNLVKLTELLVKLHDRPSKRDSDEDSPEDEVAKTRASLI